MKGNERKGKERQSDRAEEILWKLSRRIPLSCRNWGSSVSIVLRVTVRFPWRRDVGALSRNNANARP
jgi:hypothetical protein